MGARLNLRALLACAVLLAVPVMAPVAAPASTKAHTASRSKRSHSCRAKKSKVTRKVAKKTRPACKPKVRRKAVAKPKSKPTPLAPGASAPAAEPIAAPPSEAVPAPAPAPAPAGVPPPAPQTPATPMYWGTWTDTHRTATTQPPWDMTVLDRIEADIGKGASLVEFSTPMAYGDGATYFSFPSKEMTAIRGHGSIPFFSWSTHAMRNYSDPRFDLQSIIDGEQDAQILRWADAARRWGSPFFLRFNWEMNGTWFPWSESYGANTPGQFVQAWRHVHDLFDQAGATKATWVWCPSADPWRVEQPLASLYPGDGYVDWTCMDVYNYNSPRQSFAQVAQSSYDEIAAIAPSKPMVIAETSSTEAGGSKADWITALFADLPLRFPLIRGLIWFDSTNGGSSAYTDYPLDSSPGATAAFARGIAGAGYQANRYAGLTGGKIAPPG
jgi:hypothetical protein